MGKSLVIVESPAKAKTINKFLGSNYIVKPTGGHLIDLPTDEIGIDVKQGFKPRYCIIKGKAKTLGELKKNAKEADTILLATDPDREGEAIAWHVAQRIVGENQQSYRILLNQITRDAVLDSVKNKVQLDMNKVNAQQARRVLDRLVGYMVSPFLWKTVYKGLSAGRVQSVALRLIVERDIEIESFVPEEYWDIRALLATRDDKECEAKLVSKNGEALKIRNAAEAEALVQELKTLTYTVSDITVKRVKRNPSPPFITSTLQQEAARRLGFLVAKTMHIAQTLYEGVELGEGSEGVITYMRTDSTRTAPEAVKEVRDYIGDTWGREQLPDTPNYYKTSKTAQDAHEAIRPTYVANTPDIMKQYLTPDQYKLYTLIWNRFAASQMRPAEYINKTAVITAGDYELRANSSRLEFEGFLKVYKDYVKGEDEEREAADFPASLVKGAVLILKELLPAQHFTKPPANYTEATLVKELESLGIGRPSTYAQIIHTLHAREYAKRMKGKLISTELGRKVNDILIRGFPNLFNVKFTANMEEELDKIESGEYKWLNVVNDFYGPFSNALDTMNVQRHELKQSMIEKTGEVCEKCGSPMVIRWGRNGKFIACSAFPKCRNTKPLEGKSSPEKKEEKCDKCGSPMELKTGKFGKFLSCSNFPACRNIKPYSLGMKCPIEGCDGGLAEKRSKKGRVFYGCTNYPKCSFASWDKPVAKECVQCHSPVLMEKKNGESLYCPRCKAKYDHDTIEVQV